MERENVRNEADASEKSAEKHRIWRIIIFFWLLTLTSVPIINATGSFWWGFVVFSGGLFVKFILEDFAEEIARRLKEK